MAGAVRLGCIWGRSRLIASISRVDAAGGGYAYPTSMRRLAWLRIPLRQRAACRRDACACRHFVAHFRQYALKRR